MPDEIDQNIQRVRERIARACDRAGRDPGDVLLVGVTKAFPVEVVRRAVAVGLHELGENRLQELREKAEQVEGPVRWHLIGHLQSNKSKTALEICDVIHTVDSIPLAQKLSREAVALERDVEILIQVNVGGEPQKSGVSPEEVTPLAETVRDLERLRLRGLMTIPPIAEPQQTRVYFRQLRQLRDQLRADLLGAEFSELSMGMTDDFELAVEEGSTILRIGRAIFGER
jgi:pyridoxal phosphate enzyme (YggS family)